MTKHSKLELTPRLRTLADWIRPGASIADIGTDHAYLPVWLVLQGRVSTAIAGDLRRGPLARGAETAAEYGVSDRVDLRLCNGLAGIGPEEADTIVIAGMGGENIADILGAAPWTADGAHTLLLQPMTRVEVLREFLSHSGYAITRECLVLDRGTIYPIMEVTAGQMELSAGQLYGGAKLIHDPLGERYLIEKTIRFQSAVAGLNRSDSPEDAVKADRLRDLMGELLRMREEWRHANCPSN